MNLKILLPFRVFCERGAVRRLVGETVDGFFGILPRRLDCVATLVPGIFMYQAEGEAETYMAVDQGVMVKTGSSVLVSVRRAIGGSNLAELRAAVEREFLTLDENEKSVRSAMVRLEDGFLSRFGTFRRG